MKIYYRISDTGYNKVKPDYINNENCLSNFCKHFSDCDITIIADNISDNTYDMICKYTKESNITNVYEGNGAATFNIALTEALKLNDSECVYFVENDYIHLPNSCNVLQEGLDFGIAYVTLYDHPDKYLDPSLGGNPYCQGGAENTKVFLTHSTHWKITNSTTMTFATRVETLRQDEEILRRWTSDTHPHDFKMFIELNQKGRNIISPIPSYATHGETKWLSPLVNWRKSV